MALEDLRAEEQVVLAILHAMELPSAGGMDPKRQLLINIGPKQLLLVLDNFEQLLEAVGLLAGILEETAGVRLLVTSREKLSLHGEQLYPMTGLVYPESVAGLSAGDGLVDYSAPTLVHPEC